MTAEQCAERQAAYDNVPRDLIESLRLIRILARFGTGSKVREAIAVQAERAIDHAKEHGYA